jgi:hypothetical protein
VTSGLRENISLVNLDIGVPSYLSYPGRPDLGGGVGHGLHSKLESGVKRSSQEPPVWPQRISNPGCFSAGKQCRHACKGRQKSNSWSNGQTGNPQEMGLFAWGSNRVREVRTNSVYAYLHTLRRGPRPAEPAVSMWTGD